MTKKVVAYKYIYIYIYILYVYKYIRKWCPKSKLTFYYRSKASHYTQKHVLRFCKAVSFRWNEPSSYRPCHISETNIVRVHISLYWREIGPLTWRSVKWNTSCRIGSVKFFIFKGSVSSHGSSKNKFLHGILLKS